MIHHFGRADNSLLKKNNSDVNKYKSRIALYSAKVLMFTGIFLIVLDNQSFFNRSQYFGTLDWPTGIVFFIGIILSFFLIPYLYFSSFRRFKKADDFWDDEAFWILPLFFFGMLFQYGSKVYFLNVVFFLSALIVFLIHFYISSLAKKISQHESLEGRYQYFQSMQYLTFYYLILVALFYFSDFLFAF